MHNPIRAEGCETGGVGLELQESNQRSAPTGTVSAPKGVFRLVAAFKRILTSSTNSFEDAESLLNNLVLFAAFTYAFSTSLMTGTFSHDDLVAADQRHAVIRLGNLEWKGEANALISTRFLYAGETSSCMLIITMLLGLFLIISLSFSDCRECPAALNKWLRVGAPLIALSYALFIGGLVSFFNAAHLSIELNYPMYPVPPDVNFWRGDLGIRKRYQWEHVFNFTSMEMIFLTGEEVLDGSKRYEKGDGPLSESGLGIIWAVSQGFTIATTTAVITISVVGLCSIMYFNLWASHDLLVQKQKAQQSEQSVVTTVTAT